MQKLPGCHIKYGSAGGVLISPDQATDPEGRYMTQSVMHLQCNGPARCITIDHFVNK